MEKAQIMSELTQIIYDNLPDTIKGKKKRINCANDISEKIYGRLFAFKEHPLGVGGNKATKK